MSVIEAVTLALITGSALGMLAAGQYMWYRRHRFFGAALCAGGAAMSLILLLILERLAG